MSVSSTMRRKGHSAGRCARAAVVLLAGLAGSAMLGVTPDAGLGLGPSAAWAQSSQSGVDQVIFKDGKTITCTVLEETSTTVKVRVKVGGIEAETTYDKSQILTISRGVKPAETDPAPAPEARKGPTLASGNAAADSADAKSVYVMELKGWFGTDIAVKPLEQVMADAKKHQPDFIIVKVNNDWSLNEGLDQLSDDIIGAFDDLFLAVEMDPVLTTRVQNEWDKQPRLVFWVKSAMGGAAFLPFISHDVYFTSEGKMGGVGGVDVMFGSTGDEVVRQKQYSLRVATARGLARKGGHATELIDAMSLIEYVLSVSWDGDKPVYHTRMPEGPHETLLTDNGLEAEHVDFDRARVSGEGNDVLTLRADMAQKLQLSRGTADTLDDLLAELGIGRNHRLIESRAEAILETWRDGIYNYGRNLRNLLRDYEDIQVQGETARERNQARARQIAKLEEMQKLIKKFEGAMDPRQEGAPDYNTINVLIQRIKLEMQLDK